MQPRRSSLAPRSEALRGLLRDLRQSFPMRTPHMRTPHMRKPRVLMLAGWLLGALCGTAGAYPPPPADPSLPPSKIEPTVQQMRRAMLDPDLNSLTFHNMDQLFTTRVVGRSGPVWHLPRAEHAPDFTYSFKGSTYTPGQFLERTYTNALLIMKDGRIVYETYRNNTNEATRFIAFSMTKSIISILVGIALQEQRIKSIED